jgi:hypothetical protein
MHVVVDDDLIDTWPRRASNELAHLRGAPGRQVGRYPDCHWPRHRYALNAEPTPTVGLRWLNGFLKV